MSSLRSRLLTVLLLTLVGSNGLRAQDDDVSKYFDDGGISKARAALMLNAAALGAADLSLSLEYSFTRMLSLEIDGGIMLPYKRREAFISLESATPPVGQGFSMAIFPKLYYSGEAPHGGYGGLIYRRRSFDGGHSIDFIPAYGLKMASTGRFAWEFFYGNGIRILVTDDYYTDFGLIFTVGLKFGFIF